MNLKRGINGPFRTVLLSVLLLISGVATASRSDAGPPDEKVPTWGYDFGNVTDESLSAVTELAEAGDVISMVHLGEAYRSGLLEAGFDFALSYQWYKAAADAGNAQAQLQLFQIYDSGAGIAVDSERARFWVEESARQGHFEAQYYFSQSLFSADIYEERLVGLEMMVSASERVEGFLARRGLSIQSQEFFPDLKKSEFDGFCSLIEARASDAAGITGALVALANCLENGYEPRESSLSAMDLRVEAARRGQIFFKVPDQFPTVGFEYLENAKDEVRRLASIGHKHSIMVIADCFIFGERDDGHSACKEQSEGFLWNKKAAAEIGNIFFPDWLAVRYAQGIGTPRDIVAAEAVWLSLAKAGYPQYMASVSEQILDGNTRLGGYDDALSFADGAYQLDRSQAATLARFYLEGAGVPFDHERGASLLAEAAEDGNHAAAFKLATLLESGVVVERQLERARDLYQQAADAGWWFESFGDPSLVKKAGFAAQRIDSFLSAESQVEEAVLDLDLGRYRALLIANSNYDALPDLSSPSKDVERLRDQLVADYGFELQVLFDATRAETLEALNQYRKTLTSQDNFLLYFAGHGTFDRELQMGFWQPVEADPAGDYTWIETARVARTLSGFKSRNILVIADSCFSAAVVRGQPTVAASTVGAGDLQSLVDRKTRMAITSGGLEPVLDNDPSSQNSVFASVLLENLSANQDIITASELFNSIRPTVSQRAKALGLEQIPEYAPLYRAGHDGGDFIFRRLKVTD